MKHYVLFCTIFLFAHSKCDVRDGSRIIGGRYAKKGEFPYIVVISFRPFSSSCGGGILSPLYVLTACHCTTQVIEPFGGLPQAINGDYSNTRVIAGSVARDAPHDQGYQLRWVYRWMQHPKCKPLLTGEWVYDIAVIQVTTRFIFNDLVQPLAIPPTQLRLFQFVKMSQVIKRGCVIAGWGFTTIVSHQKSTNASSFLKALAARLLSPIDCSVLLCEYTRYSRCIEDVIEDTPDRLCAAAKFSKAGTVCSGDSGGPLVCGGVAVGVVSYSSSCSLLDDPVVYARIDKSYEFISQYYIHSLNYIEE